MAEFRQADVVVIGGGIMGLATAYELAKRVRSVVVLEKGTIGGEASGRNGGGVRQQKRDPRELPLAMASVKIWQGLSEELDWDLEYRQGGNIHILSNPAVYDGAVKLAMNSQTKGLQVEVLNPEETKKVLPAMNQRLEILGSTYCPVDGTANPLLVCQAYARAAKRLGVIVKAMEPVMRLEVKSGRVTAVLTEKCEYRAENFVIAAGAWSKPLCNQVGLDYPVEIKRSQLLVTEALPPTFSEFVSADCCSPYFRQALNGGVHIGVPSAPVEGYNKLSTYDAFKIAGEGSRLLFPFLEKVNVIHAWSGLTNWTPDKVCIIDKAPQVEGLFLTAGHSGHGYCLGPITGRLLAEWIVDGSPSMDLSGLRWTRFDKIFL